MEFLIMDDGVLAQAKKLHRARKYSDALVIYFAQLQVDPVDTDALNGAADCLYNLRRFNEMIEMCNNALAINPNLVAPYVILAYLYYDNNDEDKSFAQAQKALELGAKSSDAQCCYGTLLLFEGQYQDAINFLRKAIALDPDMYLAHENLGACYQKIGNTREFYNEEKTLFRLKPTFTNVIGLVGAFFEANRMVLALFVLAPFLIIANTNLKPLLVFHLILILFYISSALIAMKNRQLQDAKTKFIRALMFIFIVSFTLIFY